MPGIYEIPGQNVGTYDVEKSKRWGQSFWYIYIYVLNKLKWE